MSKLTPVLILLSGLPGTGKTKLGIELSQRLGVPHLGKDHFQSVLRKHEITGREGAEGYYLALALAKHFLENGIGAILDGVFPQPGFRNVARQMAEDNQAIFLPIHCFCSSERVWQERLQRRDRYVPDWTPVGWDEVERVAAHYEPWPRENALFVDASHAFDLNLQTVMEWVSKEESDASSLSRADA